MSQRALWMKTASERSTLLGDGLFSETVFSLQRGQNSRWRAMRWCTRSRSTSALWGRPPDQGECILD